MLNMIRPPMELLMVKREKNKYCDYESKLEYSGNQSSIYPKTTAIFLKL